MKTTIEIPNSLLDEARRIAQQEQTTLKALMEEGLRRVLAEHRQRGSFALRNAAFKGEGLQSSLEGADWSRLRDMSYEGRGS